MPSARRSELLRSSAFRVALAICLVVVVAFTISGLITWRRIEQEVVALQERRIETVFHVLDIVRQRDGTPALLETADRLSAPAVGNAPRIAVTTRQGGLLAGQPMPFDAPDGWSTRRDEVEGTARRFRVLRRPLDDLSLVIAIETNSVARAINTILHAMGASAAAAFAVAIVGGGVIASRLNMRQARLKATLDQIAAGNLQARVPLSERRDDFEEIAIGLNRALDRLEALVDGMRQVSSDISHDLRTPLSRMRMTLHEVAEALPEEHPAHALLDRAIAEGVLINQTFSALLRISEIESGARRTAFAPFDLTATVAEIVETYQVVGEETGHAVSADLPDAPVLVTGDRELVVQALVNLIENAIRHTPAGCAIACRVRDRPAPSVEVRDTGPGIPETETVHVLQRLYRLERSRSTPGSGLGLSLVKAVADLHQATLTLEDAAPGLAVRLQFDHSAAA